MSEGVGRLFFFTLMAALALPASSQVSSGRASVNLSQSPHVTRAPYTAEYKSTMTERLADGNSIVRESTEVSALDSEGRHMRATTEIPTNTEQAHSTRITVFDPIARTNSEWSVPGQRAIVTAMPEPERHTAVPRIHQGTMPSNWDPDRSCLNP